ncbi:hypothetical protein Tco_1504900 [Tanacetum coccineum]
MRVSFRKDHLIPKPIPYSSSTQVKTNIRTQMPFSLDFSFYSVPDQRVISSGLKKFKFCIGSGQKLRRSQTTYSTSQSLDEGKFGMEDLSEKKERLRMLRFGVGGEKKRIAYGVRREGKLLDKEVSEGIVWIKLDGKSATQTALTPTSTPTPTTIGDDETIAQVLITMSQNKQKEKEKELEIRNFLLMMEEVAESSRGREDERRRKRYKGLMLVSLLLVLPDDEKMNQGDDMNKLLLLLRREIKIDDSVKSEY